MPTVVHHRINEAEQLLNVPLHEGVEIDVRIHNSQLIVAHDPFQDGQSLSHWLRAYNHQLLILNVKEEGLEPHILNILADNNIDNFLFLDQGLPSLVKYHTKIKQRSLFRLSEFESIESVVSSQDLFSWVWVDYFTYSPLTHDIYGILASLNKKICIVSPELQGFSSDVATDYRNSLNQQNISWDAACTKIPETWRHV